MNTLLNEEKKQKRFIAVFVGAAVLCGILAFVLVSHLLTVHKKNTVMRETMGETMEGFVGALEDGNIGKAKSFCSDQASATLGLSMLDADSYRTVVLSGLAMEEETLSDELRAAMDDFTTAQKSRILTACEYELKSMKLERAKNGGTGTLTVTLTGVPSLYSVDFSQKIVKGNEDLAAYVTENRDLLIGIYGTEGEVVTYNVLKSKEIVNLLSSMSDQMLSTEPVTRKYDFTFEMTTDDEGKVSDCLIQRAEEINEDDK